MLTHDNFSRYKTNTHRRNYTMDDDKTQIAEIALVVVVTAILLSATMVALT